MIVVGVSRLSHRAPATTTRIPTQRGTSFTSKRLPSPQFPVAPYHKRNLNVSYMYSSPLCRTCPSVWPTIHPEPALVSSEQRLRAHGQFQVCPALQPDTTV